MTTRTATARYEGLGPEGKGHVSTQSGIVNDQPYDFRTRFGEAAGTNPEELAAAAHASCFTMALSFALAQHGFSEGVLETKAAVTLDKDGAGFKITKSALTLKAQLSGITQADFERIAGEAKANCPISKLFNAEISLEATLEA